MTLYDLDYRLFFFINHDCSNPVFDSVCPLLREKLFWIPVYIFIAIVAFRKWSRSALLAAAFAALTIAVSDYSSASIIKPIFHRLRPCNNPDIMDQVRLLVEACGSGFSFVSAHAANHFALAAFLSFLFHRKLWQPLLLFTWAASVGFSQIYVGVHYPADVVCGGFLGCVIGVITGFSCHRLLYNKQR